MSRTQATATEPICCDEPMIHNSFTGQYECTEAYLRLLDDGVLGGVPELSDTDAMNDYQRERYEHWKTSRVVDAAAATVPGDQLARASACRWQCSRCGRFVAESAVHSEDRIDPGTYYGVTSRTWADCAQCGEVDAPRPVVVGEVDR